MEQSKIVELQKSKLNRRDSSIVLITVGAAAWLVLVLLVSQGVMFAPPYTASSLALYGLLMLIGLIALSIVALRKRPRSTSKRYLNVLAVLLIVLIGVLTICLWLGFFGPVAGAGLAVGIMQAEP